MRSCLADSRNAPRIFYSFIQLTFTIYFKGEAQREPALKLVASLIDRVGMEFVLPPNMKDNKVLLMIIHLSCIEVRMTLENYPIDKVCLETHVMGIVILKATLYS